MGDADSQPAADGDAERNQGAVELIGSGYHGKDNTDVLYYVDFYSPFSVQKKSGN